MLENEYGDLIERWKVDLIRARARRFGFRPDDIPDLEQTIVLELLSAGYRPGLEGGAAERTFTIAVIDRQLKETLRSRRRDLRRVNHEARSLDADPAAAEEVPSPRPDSTLDGLSLDVQAAMVGLTPTERAICQALSEGQSQADIARERGCSRAAISKHIAQVALKLCGWGVDAYVTGRRRKGQG
ncbi:MAG TPA: sigma-70 family RNA polymerase sigma factor [Planctomycetota bacterium]|nr:sigma-70 family RNA polymerase sigma factor [Planctomycetota bacterium]HRT95318.1 sigma-70 family RNA polymerase sigma factor [Planctomycetota bacterium]